MNLPAFYMNQLDLMRKPIPKPMTLTEKPASYYDKIYAGSQKYKAPYQDSVYYPLWLKIAEWIPERSTTVLDVGCGTGQLCSMLKSSGYLHVTGIDFSQEAIATAKKTCSAIFKVADLYSFSLYEFYETLILTEVLEHLEQDVALMKRINWQHVIFSVPSFDDPAHVRTYKSLADIKQRYPLLNITRSCSYKKWFLIEVNGSK